MESIARYLEAIQEINLAQNELDRIVEMVVGAAQILPEGWARVSVVSTKEPFLPQVPEGEERYSISAAQWPSIARITKCLSQLHQAYDGAEAAWDDISPEYRERLASPPKKFPNAQHHAALAGQSEA